MAELYYRDLNLQVYRASKAIKGWTPSLAGVSGYVAADRPFDEACIENAGEGRLWSASIAIEQRQFSLWS